jgi:predicted Zn-dependent protease
MRTVAVLAAFTVANGLAAPASAQFGNLGKITKRAQQVQKLADLDISDRDERAIGEQVSARLVDRFGIHQDAKVAKYVTLVGVVLAQASTRPALDWKFIVLDTDGVNAYAAPGGIIHITRGALGLFDTEAELAGVLGHEIAHITEKHTVRAIQKGNLVQLGADEAGASGGLTGALIGQIANRSYDIVFNNKFNRNDENESDKVGVTLANRVGYSPNGLSAFLTRLAERNRGMQEPNGLFASHPLIKERLDRLARIIKQDKLTATATVQARYGSTITFEAKPVTAIAALDVDGARGVAGGGSDSSKPGEKADVKDGAQEQKEQPRKKGFGLGNLASSLTQGKQAESTQASVSAGGRMGVPDTNAPGGAVKTPVRFTISAAEIAEFRKGIA